MRRLGDYYKVLSTISNWAPHKLIEIENDLYVFESLNDKKISKVTSNFGEIDISPLHLERLGFSQNRYENIVAFPQALTIGIAVSKIEYINLGYIVYHIEEIQDMQEKFNEVMAEINNKINTNQEISHEFVSEMRTKLSSCFSINDFFRRLEQYNITVADKNSIITG